MISSPSGATPVVIFGYKDAMLPIYIGIGEAISISSALQNETPPRPMTHDLMVSLLESLMPRLIA